MGFKVDTSFLRFLTMGALGVHQVKRELRERGFEPIELERYCGSNKIWATKVKRLRLPDLLCVKTGMRAEVRAKSDLKIKMSDAPNNPERAWDAGMRDEDVIALIACEDGPTGPVPANNAVYFTVEALRSSVADSKLGPPKSASEGAERDRTWPATIPKRPGRVLSAVAEKLVVNMEGDGSAPRKQTYTLRGKTPYVRPGDTFGAGISILAGAPTRLADLDRHRRHIYDPIAELGSAMAVDRYAAAKALLYREDLHYQAASALEGLIEREDEARVALEAAGTAAALGSERGRNHISRVLWEGAQTDLSMEAIFILTELQTEFARKELLRVAESENFAGDERRQAAVWGLGKTGLKSYRDLVTFIADREENVAYHAITAFGSDAPPDVINGLVDLLIESDSKKAPAASEALRAIGSEAALERLINAVGDSGGPSNWVLATIGRFPPELVRLALKGTQLLDRLAPMLLVAEGANWLSTEDAATDMAFLLKQYL